MGKYFCGTCKLFDDDVSKKQYHCGGCGICRTGGSENCFHRDKCDDIDADLDQGGGGGGGSTSTFYAAPLGFSGSSSENEGDEINDANLQQVMEDFDD
ncbi:uncharacterized protein LOC107612175 isoform X6 [Arachis ipaensis]|uniref:uncharacterized protein LOC107612175 isoform X6 n=1 Tax=Arachis ipaensis TaxID=130454 RepID=UPI000A2B4B1C|nr:uncharacterized protein LOC107612175 isoform X6 [Arachis ipaensis]